MNNVAQRRLAAIVVADVAGYSRLMERDELGTHARVKEILGRIIEPGVAMHRGRLVNVAGDGLLMEFDSAASALRCSIDVQRTMLLENRSQSDDSRIEFRFGINLGDIIVDGNDIAGDGINVASRVQTLAEPGGICVSAAVRDQVHGGLDVRFVDIGERHVKNIARAIRIYRIDMAARRCRNVGARLGPRARWRLAAGAFVTCAVVGVGPASFNPQAAATEEITEPSLMSVAILPFMPRDGIDRTVAQRLSQDVTTAVQRAVRPAHVVSHGLAAKFAVDGASDPRRARGGLNVRYVVEGDLDRVNDAIDVRVRLIDTANGAQLWSDRVSTTSPSPQSDDQNVARLANHISDAIGRAEARRVMQLPMSTAGSLERVLRANASWHLDGSLAGTLAARALYDEALTLDPRSAAALIGKAYTLHMQLVDDPNADRDGIVKDMDDLSKRAVRADPSHPLAWLLRGNALSLQGRRKEAFEANGLALQLDPYMVSALQDQAALLTAMGKPAEALPLLDQARSLDSPGERMHSTLLYACRAHIALGNYSAAIDACEKAEALGLDWWFLDFVLTAAYAQNGDMAKASEHKAALLRKRPDMSIERFRRLKASDDPTYLAQTELHLIEGLRKAGLHEQ